MAQNTDGYRKQIKNVNDLPGFDKMYLFAGAPKREFDKYFVTFFLVWATFHRIDRACSIRTIKQTLVPVQGSRHTWSR